MSNKLVIHNPNSELWFDYPGAIDSIRHYGVLGMKWGVRKDRQLTSGGVIKKGTKIVRLTSNPRETNSGSTFAIAKTKNGSYPEGELKFIKGWIEQKPDTRLYQIDMKTKMNLILPSMREKGETLVNDLLSDPKISKQILVASDKFLGPNRMDNDFAKSRKDSLKAAKKLKTIDLDPSKTGFEAIKDPDLKTAYTAFTQALNDEKVRGAYISCLSKRGFTGVSDDLMDADMKNLLYNNRGKVLEDKMKIAGAIGGSVGFAVSLPTFALTGIPAATPVLGAAGALIGASLSEALNKKAFPNDKSAYGTSSVIIFDREGSLDIIRTKELKS